MTLVEEINAEREGLLVEARRIMDEMIDDARLAIEQHGAANPLIIALEGNEEHVFHPHWGNAWEKIQCFKYMRDTVLAGRNITATVFLLPGTLTLKDGTEERCLTVVAHTSDWKEMRVVPFKVEGGRVRWAKQPITHSRFISNLLSIPYRELD